MQVTKGTLVGIMAICRFGYAQEIQSAPPPGYGAIEGIVLSENGKPLAGANVSTSLVGKSMPGVKTFAVTDEYGAFLLDHVRLGLNMIHVQKDDAGYPDSSFAFFAGDIAAIPTVLVEEGKVSRNVLVKMDSQGANLTGRIVDSETGKPVVSARIKFVREHTNAFVSIGPDINGNFDVSVPSRPFRMEVSATGYRTWAFKEVILLSSGTHKQLPIRLQPAKNQ